TLPFATILAAILATVLPIQATAGQATYTRDADGRIASVTSASGTTRYSYFPDGEIREVLHPDGSREVYDHDELVAAHRLADRLAADDARASAHTASAGFTSGTSPLDASANRFTFAGYYFDRATGLYYAKARFYDPTI